VKHLACAIKVLYLLVAVILAIGLGIGAGFGWWCILIEGIDPFKTTPLPYVFFVGLGIVLSFVAAFASVGAGIICLAQWAWDNSSC
jgi:hypothetical protein